MAISTSRSPKKAFLAVVSACVLAVSLFGCAGQQSEPQAQEEQEVTYRAIGVENEDSLNMRFANDTGKDIVSVAAKAVSQDGAEFGKNLIEGDEPWAPDEKVTIFCDTYEVIEAAQGENAEAVADIELLPTYDLQMTFSDDAFIVLHDVTFDEAEEVQVHVDEPSGLGYMTYDIDGKEASTLQTEIAAKEAEEAAAAAALQAQQEAEAAAAAAAAEQQASQSAQQSNSRNYNYSSGNAGGSGSGSGSGSGAGQSQGSCIDPDDLVLNE